MREMALHSLSIDLAHEEITALDTQNDIWSYTDMALRSILVHNKAAKNTIRDKVLKKSQGLFLWVTLVLEQLKDNWHTVDEIDRILNDIPEGMELLYGRMIQTISSQAARPRAMASRVLTWAVCSFHPLEIGELEVALTSEFGKFVSLESTVTQLCAGFVVVKGKRLSLIHDTARSFLLSRAGGQPLEIDPESGHEYVARTCLRFLMEKTKNWRRILSSAQPSMSPSTGNWRRPSVFDDQPFLSYAAMWWAYHVSLAPPDSHELVQVVHDFLGSSCLVWINAVALLGDLRILTRAAQYIKLAVKGMESLKSPEDTRSEELKQWTKDLLRVVGRFGDILIRNPSSIYKHVAPFCPSGSMMHQKFVTSGGLEVVGIFSTRWDDCLSRLPLGTDDFATDIACTGAYVVGVARNGVLIVWHAESCEEVRRLNHGEWVSVIACGIVPSLVATAGTKTIRVWDLTSGDEIYCLPNSSDRKILALSFGKGDEELLVRYDDASIQCLELKTSEEKWDHAFDVPPDAQHTCPHMISFSPNHSHVLLAYRGKPMCAWSLGALNSSPHVCIRPEDRLGSAEGEHNASMWRAATPERVVWRPGQPAVFILYNDAACFEWHIEDDVLRQIPDIVALDMALSSAGNTLLTSNYNGKLSVWAVPQFRLIYQLQETDIVRCLAFSPDGQRFYDITGALCSVWEPDALLRPDDPDQDQLSVSHNTALSEPLSAVTVTAHPDITALVSDAKDRFHCYGNDSGAVVIHDTRTGKRVRKLYGHATIASVTKLAWSPTCQFIASADNCGRVIVKRLRKPSPENDTWGVYPLLDFRLGDAVLHLLFSASDEYLLVASMGSTGVWDMRSRKRISLSERPFKADTKWLNHPTDDGLLLAISYSGLHVFRWDSLAVIGPEGTAIAVAQGLTPDEPQLPQIANLSLKGAPSCAVSLNATQVVLGALPKGGRHPTHTKRRNIMVIDIELSTQPLQPKPVDDELSAHVHRLIGAPWTLGLPGPPVLLLHVEFAGRNKFAEAAFFPTEGLAKPEHVGVVRDE